MLVEVRLVDCELSRCLSLSLVLKLALDFTLGHDLQVLLVLVTALVTRNSKFFI